MIYRPERASTTPRLACLGPRRDSRYLENVYFYTGGEALISAAICVAVRNASVQREERRSGDDGSGTYSRTFATSRRGLPGLRAPEGVCLDVSRCARWEVPSAAACVRYVAPINRVQVPPWLPRSGIRTGNIYRRQWTHGGCCCVSSTLERPAALPSRAVPPAEKRRAMTGSRSDVRRTFDPELSFRTRDWYPRGNDITRLLPYPRRWIDLWAFCGGMSVRTWRF